MTLNSYIMQNELENKVKHEESQQKLKKRIQDSKMNIQ